MYYTLVLLILICHSLPIRLAAGDPPHMKDYGDWISCMGSLRVEVSDVLGPCFLGISLLIFGDHARS